MFHRNNTSLQRISAAIVILIGYMIKILEGFFLFCKGRNPTPWNRKATSYPGGGWICSLPRDYHSGFLLRVWSEIRECSGNLTQFSSLNYLNSLVIHKIFTSSPGLWLVHDLLLFQNLSKTLLTMALILSKHGRFGHGWCVLRSLVQSPDLPSYENSLNKPPSTVVRDDKWGHFLVTYMNSPWVSQTFPKEGRHSGFLTEL